MMNRRDFFKLVGKIAVGVVIVPMLPKPMTNKVLPPDPYVSYPSGTFAGLDRFLSENAVQPVAVWGDPLAIDKVVEIYEASQYA